MHLQQRVHSEQALVMWERIILQEISIHFTTFSSIFDIEACSNLLLKTNGSWNSLSTLTTMHLYLTQRLHSEIDKSQQLSCSSVLEHNTSNYKSDLCPFFPLRHPRSVTLHRGEKHQQWQIRSISRPTLMYIEDKPDIWLPRWIIDDSLGPALEFSVGFLYLQRPELIIVMVH